MGEGPLWKDDEDFGTDADPIAQEAATWFAAVQAGTITPAERASLRAWLRRNPRHQAAYADVERIWSGVAELPAVKERRRASRRDLTRRALGKAAIAAVVGGGGWLAYRQHPFADYRTDIGERRTVRLADNSSVELAAETALSVALGPQSRFVTLHRGEAYFSVARDPARPFVVEAGEGRTTAIAASFNVDYVSDDEVRITAAEQAVGVRLGARDLRLEAGSQVAYGRNDIREPQAVDPATELAWRDGRLVFVSQPFGRVVASLNRWRPGRLRVMSAALAARPVTLIVDLEKSGDVLPVLENTLPIRVVSLSTFMTLIFEA